VLVPRTVKDLVVGSGLEFNPRVTHELKGVPGSCELFALADSRNATIPVALDLRIETPGSRVGYFRPPAAA
jgi:hypothetical protein